VLVNIENLAGSEYDDVLSGDGFRNELYGRAGNDTLKGAAATTASRAMPATTS
jgi:Ca2+-binding RTX toxin-like protein